MPIIAGPEPSRVSNRGRIGEFSCAPGPRRARPERDPAARIHGRDPDRRLACGDALRLRLDPHASFLREAALSRSVTVPLPGAGLIARAVVAIAIVALVVFAALRMAATISGGAPVTQLAAGAPLQVIRTAAEVYLGKIAASDGDYLRLVGPAVVRETAAPSGSTASSVIVIRLTADPFDVDGDLLIPRESVISVGNVTRDSGLERAYRQAIGDLPVGPAASASPQP